jgi:molybdopterin-guanine dinucleotide biosynthesis protein A
MGGADKLSLDVGGSTLLERAIGTARRVGARHVVVVGPRRPITHAGDVTWTQEETPGGGPVPAIAAGVRALDDAAGGPGTSDDDDAIVVLAGDVPFATDAVRRLLEALAGRDASVLTDVEGRDQYLVAAYRRGALRDSVASMVPPTGLPARALLADLDVVRVAARSTDESLDCDTPADLERVIDIIRSR